jgi:hypothetical protein
MSIGKGSVHRLRSLQSIGDAYKMVHGMAMLDEHSKGFSEDSPKLVSLEPDELPISADLKGFLRTSPCLLLRPERSWSVTCAKTKWRPVSHPSGEFEPQPEQGSREGRMGTGSLSIALEI